MSEFDGWEKIEVIGSGGQGEVWKARSPATKRVRDEAIASAKKLVRRLSAPAGNPIEDAHVLELAKAWAVLRVDPPEDIGALKVFKFGETGRDAQGLERLKNEVKALERLKGVPGVLQLLHANPDKRFMVTEYLAHGTLSDRHEHYAGRPLEALEGIRPLVSALDRIHAERMIHRDIKPDNVFVRAAGELVLGDFGIVLFDQQDGRITQTYENAGSRDWQAGWTMGHRVEDLRPACDLFSVGKVLWAMVSGKRRLNLWYYRRPENDLEVMFPDDEGAAAVNAILARCVVEYQEDCIATAAELLSEVDAAIIKLRGQGGQFSPMGGWRCRQCGRGRYHTVTMPSDSAVDRLLSIPSKDAALPSSQAHNAFEPWVRAVPVRLFSCDHCGHLEIFQNTVPKGSHRAAWGVHGVADEESPASVSSAEPVLADPNAAARRRLDASDEELRTADSIDAIGMAIQERIFEALTALLEQAKSSRLLHSTAHVELRKETAHVFALTSDERYRRNSKIASIYFSLWSFQQDVNIHGSVQVEAPVDPAADLLIRAMSTATGIETLASFHPGGKATEIEVGESVATALWASQMNAVVEQVVAKRRSRLT